MMNPSERKRLENLEAEVKELSRIISLLTGDVESNIAKGIERAFGQFDVIVKSSTDDKIKELINE